MLIHTLPSAASASSTFYRHCFLGLEPSNKGHSFHHVDSNTLFSSFHLLSALSLQSWKHRREIFPFSISFSAPPSVAFTFYRHSALDQYVNSTTFFTGLRLLNCPVLVELESSNRGRALQYIDSDTRFSSLRLSSALNFESVCRFKHPLGWPSPSKLPCPSGSLCPIGLSSVTIWRKNSLQQRSSLTYHQPEDSVHLAFLMVCAVNESANSFSSTHLLLTGWQSGCSTLSFLTIHIITQQPSSILILFIRLIIGVRLLVFWSRQRVDSFNITCSLPWTLTNGIRKRQLRAPLREKCLYRYRVVTALNLDESMYGTPKLSFRARIREKT